MKKYINKRIYTDVESYLVTGIDEVKGTAMAIEVEKRIKPKMIPGGFAAHCPDLQREFAGSRARSAQGGVTEDCRDGGRLPRAFFRDAWLYDF